MKTLQQLTSDAIGRPYLPGHTLEILQNGDAIFPAMLAAIRSATRSIDFSTYVYWRSAIATEFANALIERAAAGVQVRLLVDAVGGAAMDSRTLWRLERAGVQMAWFRPAHLPYLHKLNHRTHRKILLVDGRTGFTGGVGIADEWTGSAQDPRHWRETHCRLTGPACADLYAGFMENWREAVREHATPGASTAPEPAQPAPQSGGIAIATAVSTARVGRPTEADRLFMAAFAGARRRLNITTAYFVPSDGVITALAAAVQRGVAVRVLTNGPATNHKVTRWAGRACYQPLLEAGVKIYEYQPTVLHTKVMTADGAWATIGSANLDARSLVLNDELNIAIADPQITAQLDAAFEDDLAASQPINQAGWDGRSWADRIQESAARLVKSQL